MTTSLEAEDAVAELLGSHFCTAATAYFNLETGVSIVSIFRDQKPDAKKVEAEIRAGLAYIAECGLQIGAGQVETLKVKREDWSESWKRHFKPIEIGVNRNDESLNTTKLGAYGSRPFGKTLLVMPSWCKKRPRKNQAVVILDPGLSFGTGQHPTSSFCLGEILRVRQAGAAQSFLDIGTGSGILAIAAAKLGYAPVHAFDFDPESIRVARANAQKNHVKNKIKLARGDVTKLPVKAAKQYDLVCANLISNLLKAERRRIVSRLKNGGTLVLAGILAAEFKEVEVAFAGLKLKLVACRVENEWCSGAFCFA